MQNSVTADVSALSKDGTGNLRVWFSFMPCKVTSLSVEVVTGSARYVRKLTGLDMAFKANARNTLAVDMSSAQRMTKPEADSDINTEVFGLLDLDYPGLEQVKEEYAQGNYGAAAAALVDYFKARTSVVNPEVDPDNVIMYTEDKRIAEQALEHRFYVRRGYWYESLEGTAYTYWDFDDASGNIDWTFELAEAGQEWYQRHWHQWFKYLAWAQVYYNDDKYFDSWKEVYTDWLENFPCPGVNGSINAYNNRSWHPLSVATRISNQLDLFPYFIRSSHFTGSWMSTFLVEFHKAVEFCRAHPYYEETSNIRFAQQTAEAKAAVLFPEFKEASSWLSTVAPQISDQFSLQFYSDGVHTEMAPNYQLGVMDNFRSIYQIAKVNGKLSSFDSDYTEKMRKACLFLANYVWPDYTWEWFNDTFEQTKGVLLNNIKRYSQMFPEENLLKYLASERAQGSVPTESLISFPVGGYYMLRNGWSGSESMLILKNNYNPANEWHCHMDNGTFALWSKGRDFLPDPGVYSYGGTSELDAMRTEHLATANHNTLTKNLQTIAKNYSKGECLLTRTSASEDLVVTQNASYSDLTHRRAVYMLDKKFYVIVDEAFGSASGVDVNLSFHLCQGTVKTDDFSSSRMYGVHTEFSDGNDMLFRTYSETSSGYTPETGTSRCSYKMNHAYDRTYYRVTADKKSASSAVRFITVIYLSRSADISASFSSSFSKTSSSVKVTVNGTSYDLSYTL
jgi:heparan-sulfate lyase